MIQSLARGEPEDHVLHGAYLDSVKPVIEAGAYEAVELPCEIAPGLCGSSRLPATRPAWRWCASTLAAAT